MLGKVWSEKQITKVASMATLTLGERAKETSLSKKPWVWKTFSVQTCSPAKLESRRRQVVMLVESSFTLFK